ncbi:AI-2E family transporter [Halalkalicoccus jeotgali]|uniref:HTR-like protein n=1 Tax=Halalkalicoccus jeotgali (strain DSM 18796 / CECT 7217 / JCM 14584 / KCTC 4019 / B3) TaxID=795797 RepID=D8J634_HALJB|nr:AI-2E family transporter [Halalkalicoccus jeotgali]ADJ15752.1 HTR-like protein [Halalkalicoccus jeotgali B3]ELY37224.1 HTR-like protein [Halalkalicoccus jeotgali B3]
MEYDREVGRRLGLGLIVLGLVLLAAYVVRAFIAVVVFAVFLYYSVRPIHRYLRRFGLPRRLRAMLAIVLFGVPFLILLAYTVAIVVIETQQFVEAYDIQNQVLNSGLERFDLAALDLDTVQRTVTTAGTQGSILAVFFSLSSAASVVGSVLIQSLILVVLTYYMLVDGPQLRAWVLENLDDTGIIRRYFDEVDPELSMTLFGNIVNVFVTAIVGVVVFFTYNVFVPEAVEVPFPSLLGALAGIGSLIPVVGIKLVYLPVGIGLAAAVVAAGQTPLLIYVGIFFVVAGVFVDFIPDFFIRALISGENTHTGMLLLSYIVGPAVFGFYGLFLVPVLLILLTNAMYVLLPYVLWGEDTPAQQTRLEDFGGPERDSPPVADTSDTNATPVVED